MGVCFFFFLSLCFFFNDTATTEIYTLSLHDALPIWAYVHLHELGHAHSVEAWLGDQLAGGLYGVAIGGLFAAETMFYRVRDASKVALVHLVTHLRARGYRLLDIQQLSDHTARLGAVEIPRHEYLARLADAVSCQVEFGGEAA